MRVCMVKSERLLSKHSRCVAAFLLLLASVHAADAFPELTEKQSRDLGRILDDARNGLLPDSLDWNLDQIGGIAAVPSLLSAASDPALGSSERRALLFPVPALLVAHRYDEDLLSELAGLVVPDILRIIESSPRCLGDIGLIMQWLRADEVVEAMLARINDVSSEADMAKVLSGLSHSARQKHVPLLLQVATAAQQRYAREVAVRVLASMAVERGIDLSKPVKDASPMLVSEIGEDRARQVQKFIDDIGALVSLFNQLDSHELQERKRGAAALDVLSIDIGYDPQRRLSLQDAAFLRYYEELSRYFVLHFPKAKNEESSWTEERGHVSRIDCAEKPNPFSTEQSREDIRKE